MDPLSALSLACNVTQIVEQAIEAVKICKQVCDRGSLAENDNIESFTIAISAGSAQVAQELKGNNLSVRDKRLKSLADDVLSTAASLQTMLNKIKYAKAQGKGQPRAFKQIVRTMINRGTILSLENQLQCQDAALRSTILKDLYFRYRSGEAQQANEMSKLGRRQQEILDKILNATNKQANTILRSQEATATQMAARVALAERTLLDNNQQLHTDAKRAVHNIGQTIIAHASKTRLDIIQEGSKNNVAILKEVNSAQHSILANTSQSEARIRIDLEQRQEQKQRNDIHRQIMDSLFFPDLRQRQDMIETRVSELCNSFSWVFDIDANGSCHFVDWLANGTGIFWINGKAGSGKSTLVDVIYQNMKNRQRGYDHLKKWAAPNDVHVLPFFFYRPARNALKTFHGFWMSLCYQLLSVDPGLFDLAAQDVKTPEAFLRRLHGDFTDRLWMTQELKQVATYLFHTSTARIKYCLLLDGLDEFSDNQYDLIQNLRKMTADNPNIKICCSSRPEAPFENGFRECPFLRLQDHTGNDMMEYCLAELAGTPARQLCEHIVERAEGVFLWVYIVVNELKAAAARGDDNAELWQRFHQCPDGMVGLFAHMLERCDPYYAKNPKAYLRLVDVALSMSVMPTLFELILASYPLKDLKLMVSRVFTEDTLKELEQKATVAETQIVARCAGLVQFVPAYSGSRDEFLDNRTDLRHLQRALNIQAQFIHKTARDFLREAPEGRAFFETNTISEPDARLTLVLASTALLPLREILKDALMVITCSGWKVCTYQKKIDHTDAANSECAKVLRWYSTQMTSFFASSQAERLKMPLHPEVRPDDSARASQVGPTLNARTSTPTQLALNDYVKLAFKLQYNMHNHGKRALRLFRKRHTYGRVAFIRQARGSAGAFEPKRSEPKEPVEEPVVVGASLNSMTSPDGSINHQ